MTSRTESNDILRDLLAEIDRAWRDKKDRTIVDRLSRDYPEFQDELYEFFSDLVLGPEQQLSNKQSDAEDDVHRWILATGLDVARTTRCSILSAPTSSAHNSPGSATLQGPDSNRESTDLKTPAGVPHTWIAFLRTRTKLRLPDLAMALPHATTEYLVLVSRHPAVVPSTVKEQLAQYTQERFGIPRQDSLQCLSEAPRLLRAASRSKPFDSDPVSFADLLDRAALNPADKNFWLNSGQGA